MMGKRPQAEGTRGDAEDGVANHRQPWFGRPAKGFRQQMQSKLGQSLDHDLKDKFSDDLKQELEHVFRARKSGPGGSGLFCMPGGRACSRSAPFVLPRQVLRHLKGHAKL
jgi:hypothetical protein